MLELYIIISTPFLNPRKCALWCHKGRCCPSQVGIALLFLPFAHLNILRIQHICWDHKHVSRWMCTFTCDFTRSSSHYVYRLYLYLLSSFCLCGTTSLVLSSIFFVLYDRLLRISARPVKNDWLHWYVKADFISRWWQRECSIQNKERELELHHIFLPHNFIHSIHVTFRVCHRERCRRKSRSLFSSRCPTSKM